MDGGQLNTLLEQLRAALHDCDLEKEAEKVRSLKDARLPIIINELSILERLVTHVGAWKAIVLCKAVILGKAEEAKFSQHIWKLQGLA